MNLYRSIVKELVDKVIAFVFLLLTLPITLVLILLISIEFRFKRNPFFLQPRLGYKNRVFKIFKFRKMTEETDQYGNLLPEDQRLTKVGRFIRRSSLDEIPQFINILIGQMSLIGPRPLLAEYYPYYTPRELHRHDVKPGLTSWAIVNGRVALEWDRRFELDLQYVENISLWFDLKVIFHSVKTVIDSYLHPIDNPLAVLPLLQEYRAFIRMPYEKDDLEQLEALLSKGKNGYFKSNSVQLSDFLRNNYFLTQRYKPEFILVDDYNGTLNSFFFLKVQQDKVVVVDYFLPNHGTFLQAQQMLEKYKHLAVKYAKDIGFTQVETVEFDAKNS